jgi:hypothetical protein
MPSFLPISLQDFLHCWQPSLRKTIMSVCSTYAPCQRRELFFCKRKAEILIADS